MNKSRISCLIAVLFAVLISVPDYAYAEATDDYDYTVYNMETGEVTYHRIDDPLAITDEDLEAMNMQMPIEDSIGIAPASIIGADNREPVTNTTYRPYSYTVRIAAPGQALAPSGVVIGPCAILTAAHVVYDENGYAQSLTITPAQNGNSAPYGSITVTSADIYVPYAYTSAFSEGETPDYNPDYDWAIIYLDESDDIGNYTGWASLCPQAATFLNQTIKCVGYSGGGTTMYESDGVIRHVYDLTFTGDWDAIGGNSGGPIFVNDPTTGWTLYGIHVASHGTNGNEYSQNGTYSLGRKITGTLWHLCNSLGGD